MKDCMIDIETLSRKPGGIILSIGAVQFDPQGNGYGEKFYRNIDVNSSRAFGFTEEDETVQWWLNQSEQAKAALQVDPQYLANVIHDFTHWFSRLGLERVWCQGLDFDIPILKEYFDRTGIVEPWKYYNKRDTRTVYDICGYDPRIHAPRTGTYHHALDDAVYQITCVQTALNYRTDMIKKALVTPVK